MAQSAPSVETPPQPPRTRPGRVALFGALAGVLLAMVWSYEFVDSTIGDNVANTLLGHEAKETTIVGSTAGLVFAFVTGIAGTFTACNIAVFGALPKIAESAHSGTTRATVALLAPIGWLAAGMVAVSATYGAFGVVFADHLPQLSGGEVGGLPGRLFQASVVFGLIGLAFIYLGLAAMSAVPDPFARAPRARLVAMGALIGLFLAGRPFPLFRQLFEHAADQGNPFYGAASFVLQSVGNVLLVVLLAVVVMMLTRGGVARWLVANPRRAAAIAGFALVMLGVFLVVYWDIRVPAGRGYGWFPTMPWT